MKRAYKVIDVDVILEKCPITNAVHGNTFNMLTSYQ